MATFTLLPCKYRDGWLVKRRDATPLTVDWKGLCELVAPSQSKAAYYSLRRLVPSAFVGVVKSAQGRLSNFVVVNPDLSGDIRNIVKQNPNFPSTLSDVYRVESVVWDDVMIEGSPRLPLPTP